MTAIAVVKEPHAVHFITDTAALDDKGNLVGYTQKVATVPHLNLAITTNGTRLLLQLATEAVLDCGGQTYDEVHERVADRLKSVLTGPLRHAVEQQFRNDIPLLGNVVIGGWSSSGPHAYLVPTHSKIATMPPWRPIEIPGMYFTPSTAELEEAHREINLRFSDSAAIDLIDGMRAIIGPSVRNWSTPIVGGHVQRTSIYRDHIKTLILHRFDDQVGEPIAA